MKKQSKKILIWIITIPVSILILYLIFFIISIIPAILLSPVIIYDLIKEPNSWAEISLYYKLVVIFGTLILTGIVIKELINLVIWVRNKLK